MTGRIPCEDYNCRRAHEVLRSGPILATYHVLDVPRPLDEPNAVRVLSADEEAAALERFRPLP